MQLPKKLRVFIGLTEVSGYYSRLKKGLEELGIHAEFFPLQAHRFSYSNSEHYSSWIAEFARFCVTKRIEALNKGWEGGAFWLGMSLLSRIPLFLWAALRFDVFLLGGGSSFFRFYELPVLRLLGRKIVYTFHGTDSRPAYIDGFCEGVAFPQTPGDSSAWPDEATVRTYARVARKRKRDVAAVERYAHVVVNAPPQAQFLTRPFAVGIVVGIPFDLSGAPVNHPPAGRAVRILHSPSQHEGKGTREIRNAIDTLKGKGFAIDYVEITGRPNAEVLEEINRCDFVVDQLYSDTPMAGFAAEAAFHGKPAAVAGYYSEHVRADLPDGWMPPSLYCRPAEIADGIERLVVDRAFRRELGAQAKRFVEEHWTARQVASRYLQLIDGTFPPWWLYDPARIRYFKGMGWPDSRCRQVVRAVIERYGLGALQLADKPELEQLFVDFAYGRAA